MKFRRDDRRQLVAAVARGAPGPGAQWHGTVCGRRTLVLARAADGGGGKGRRDGDRDDDDDNHDDVVDDDDDAKTWGFYVSPPRARDDNARGMPFAR